MPDERVFTVSGSTAVPATAITLAEAGFTERSHLQEWVIAHPEMLGPGVMIVTLEFNQWRSAAGSQERDRLDVLGLDPNGRLVVAELKRDVAPDTVEMQALKYAAMASRFTAETLAAQHARFLSQRGKPTDDSEARELLEAHSKYDLVPENLAKPRIVLLASSFPPVVTATAVWLTEMSLDISLMQFQAYRAEGQVLVTVSQLYPVPDVEDFTVAPVRSLKAVDDADKLPKIAWTGEDLQKLREIASSTVLAALDLCAAQPGEWVPLRQIEQRAGREQAQARADRSAHHEHQATLRPLELAFRGPVGRGWGTAGVLQHEHRRRHDVEGAGEYVGGRLGPERCPEPAGRPGRDSQLGRTTLEAACHGARPLSREAEARDFRAAGRERCNDLRSSAA